MTRCHKCGESFAVLALMALLSDLGARVSPPALQCADGGGHDLVEEATASGAAPEPGPPGAP
jgi:hypothetical protein